MQSGIWRGTYGTPKAHDSSVRGVMVDPLNQITISGSSDCKIKFWKFKNKGEYLKITLKYNNFKNIQEPIH